MFSLFKKQQSSVASAQSDALRELNALKSERDALARSQALVELAPDGTILTASAPFAALLGYEAPELAGTSLPALAAPAGSDDRLWAALRRGEDFRGELCYAAKGGDKRWLQIAATRLTGGADGTGRILAFANDVSALRAELKTVAEELKVRQDIMNVTSIVSEGDKTGLILSCNDKYVEISKYGREELLGQGHNITRHADMPKAVFKEMWNTIGHGRIFRGVVKNRAKDGTPYYVDAVIAPILGENGKPKKYLGVRYDITASELERQNARGILAAVDESFAYVEFDLGGNVTAANDNFLGLMGYRREEVVGRHHRMFVEREHAGSQEYAQFWAELNAGNAQSELFKRITKDGTEVYIQGTYAPVKDEMGRVFKIVKIATDVTAQQRYQAEVAAVLQETSAVMREVENGNLTPQMSGSYSEEFAPLKEAVNGSIVQLREIVGKIRTGALSINTAAGEVSKGNTELSARTEEQASSLEQTAASMEEMTSTVERNAENSRQADQFASSVREQAVQGGQVVSRAIDAMAGINQSSRKIAEIIGVIDEIAFQTNLLALNAAVEAARAGDQGRGFAVVASEVRNLAQRSAAAAKEIKTLIHDSVQKVADGSKLVDESGAVLTTIVESVTKVSQIVADIAVASGEQSSGIGQVGQAVAQMDQMTQQNAALVEEAAAASESMDEESRTLITLMQFFNTGDGPATAVPAVERRSADRPWSGRSKPTPAPAAKPKAKARPAARAAAPKAAESDDWSEF